MSNVDDGPRSQSGSNVNRCSSTIPSDRSAKLISRIAPVCISTRLNHSHGRTRGTSASGRNKTSSASMTYVPALSTQAGHDSSKSRTIPGRASGRFRMWLSAEPSVQLGL